MIFVKKKLHHWTYRPNILLEVTNITSEAKTQQGERFWEAVKEQTGQDLEALKICGLLPTERNTKVTCVGVHLVSTQVCLHICLCVCANSAKAYYC